MVQDAVQLSLVVSGCATLAIALVGTALAFVLARRQFRGRALIDALVTLPLILPPTVTGYYLMILLGKHGLVGEYLHQWFNIQIPFTWIGAVIASFTVGLPIMVKSAEAALHLVDSEYEEAARTMGRSEWEVFMTVTLPLAKWGFLAGVILSFARAIGEFGATLMLAGNIPGRTQTMSLAIFEAFLSGEDSLALTLVIILTILSLSVILITNRVMKRVRR